MASYLPLIGVVLAALGLFPPSAWGGSSESGNKKALIAPLLSLLVLTALLYCGGHLLGIEKLDLRAAAAGFGFGGLLILLSGLGARNSSVTLQAMTAFGIALIAAGIAQAIQPTLVISLAMIVGAAATAFLLESGVSANGLASPTSLAITLLLSTNLLASFALKSSPQQHMGTTLGLIAAVAALVTAISQGAQPSAAMRWLGVGILLIGGLAAGFQYLHLKEMGILFAGGVLIGGLIHWLLSADEDTDSFRLLLSVMLWIAVATISFGLGRGLGMAVALLGGASTLLLLGNTRALMTIAPLLALVLYRVFREVHTNASHALDIGQHYALIGLAIGAFLPQLPLEWSRARSLTHSRGTMAATLWCVLLFSMPVLVSVMLGPKGLVGLIAGTGFSTLLGGTGRRSLTLVGGIGAASTLMFTWVGDTLQITRDEKQQWLIWMAGGLLVFALALSAVARNTNEVQAK